MERKRKIGSAQPGPSKVKVKKKTTNSSFDDQTLRRSTRKATVPVKQLPIEETPAKKKRTNKSTQTDDSAATEAKSISDLPPEETPAKKKRTNKSTQTDDSAATEAKSISDLPPEMLEAIIRNIASSDLLNCRLVNGQWNEIASQIMRNRSDMAIKFFFNGEKFKHRGTYNKVTSKTLGDLLICLKDANHFPITNYHFGDLANFANDDMTNFLSIWGKNVFTLNVGLNKPINNVGTLSDLLLVRLPNLKALTVLFCSGAFSLREIMPSSVQLFPYPNDFTLPKLKVLCVNRHYRKFQGIVESILKAACSLEKVKLDEQNLSRNVEVEHILDSYMDPEKCISIEDLAMLQTLNKLRCLKELRMDISDDLIDYWTKSPACMNLKLESLALSIQPSIWNDERAKSNATAMLNQLLQSSQNGLQTLLIEPLGRLTNLVIPELKNLRKFGMEGQSQSTDNAMFPPLFEMADGFPNVKDLDMYFVDEDNYIPSSQPPKPMPNVEVLRIVSISAELNGTLMKATPNVKTLMLEEPWIERNTTFSLNIRDISQCLPKLKKLDWTIETSTHHWLLGKLDAVMTGLQEKFCKKLSVKLRDKKRLSAEQIASYQVKRQSSSILDLKELKKFDVHFLMDDNAYWERENGVWSGDSDCESDVETGFEPGSKLYNTGFTKVSELLAFNLMPKLKVRTHRYLNS